LTENHQSQIRLISRSEFDEFEPAGFEGAEWVAKEVEWYVDQAENILGIVTFDYADEDWGYVILGRDERGQFRGIDTEISVTTRAEAHQLLLDKMTDIHDSGDTVFPQGE